MTWTADSYEVIIALFSSLDVITHIFHYRNIDVLDYGVLYQTMQEMFYTYVK